MLKWGNGSAEIYRSCIFHIRLQPNVRLWKTSDRSFKQASQSYASVEIGSYCDQWLLPRCWNEAMDGLHTTMICLFLAEVGKRCPPSNSVKARCHKSRPTAAPDGAPCHSEKKRKIKNLFMSFCTIFSYVTLGWYHDNLLMKIK